MNWINRQILMTSVVMLLSILLFEFTNLDILVQDKFFDFNNQRWLWSDDEPIGKFLLYDGIKALYLFGTLTLLGVVAFFGNLSMLQSVKKGLIIVSISLVVVPGVANLGKAISNIPCPKNLEHYGGNYPHVTLFTGYPKGFEQERPVKCYPAGHASGGFALLSLYFLCQRRRSRIVIVTSVLILSFTVGGYKMLIGDHFLSHTVATMLLAWWLTLFIARWVEPEFNPQRVT